MSSYRGQGFTCEHCGRRFGLGAHFVCAGQVVGGGRSGYYAVEYKAAQREPWTVAPDKYWSEETANVIARGLAATGSYAKVVYLPTGKMVAEYTKGGHLVNYATSDRYSRA